MKRIRVTCVIYSLKGGGAERCMTDLVNNLEKQGYDVTLMILEKNTPAYSLSSEIKRIYHPPYIPYPTYALPSSLVTSEEYWYQEIIRTRSLQGIRQRFARKVKIIHFYISFLFQRKIERFFPLRKVLQDTEPDVVISFMDITNILVSRSLVVSGIPVIVVERTDPRYYKMPHKWKIMRFIFYSFTAKVIVQTAEVCNWFKRYCYPWNIGFIPNPVFPPNIFDRASKPNFFILEKSIIALGNLTDVKRFNLLIDAFAKIASQFPDWQVTILGEGKLRSELEQQIQKLNLEQRVYLPGRIKNPTQILHHADLFVLTSEYEGFPNALLEAMSCGVAPISFDCPSGPRAIIRHDIDGLLVPSGNIEKLSIAMADLMQHEEKRKQFSQKATKVLERFDSQRIMQLWEQEIQKAITNK